MPRSESEQQMSFMDDLKHKATDLAEKAKDVAGDVTEKAKDVAGDVGERAKDVAADLGEKAKDVAADAKGKVDDLTHKDVKPEDAVQASENETAADLDSADETAEDTSAPYA